MLSLTIVPIYSDQDLIAIGIAPIVSTAVNGSASVVGVDRFWCASNSFVWPKTSGVFK